MAQRCSTAIKGTHEASTSLTILNRRHTRNEDQDDDLTDKDEPERLRKRGRKSPEIASSSTRKAVDWKTDNRSAESKKKKQRIPEQFRKVRGKLGMLERLAKDVPLDVVIEIFCYLDPGDLIRLARTSKDLRGILMSKTWESVWRIARENVQDLPPLPPDLNEPQYARLLYESYCHVCLKGNCDIILWLFRMRCCKKCGVETLPPYEDLINSQPMEYRHRGILPSEWLPGNSSYHNHRVGNTKIAEQFKAEYTALQTLEDRRNWISGKTQCFRELARHGRLCEEWHETQLEKRANEVDNVRQKRLEAILERLGEIGWREEAEHMLNKFKDHKLVKQPKKLTDHSWNGIKVELVKMLSNHKENRLRNEQRYPGSSLESWSILAG
ncbi:hypothetical protein BT96DRAFT_862210 [Gymnopus androsaceus JB14]|uniref:F-box domain-containing protein n=1 Tax=Gymnopus androsaceus JB14 TaxID=1447944 RepID=A0A6A4HB92_9AGAR|nr:hypothetical protein BT96DRAFT_862210 [Gymnopus androsaceus JB14]